MHGSSTARDIFKHFACYAQDAKIATKLNLLLKTVVN